MENESMFNLMFRLNNSSSIYLDEPDPPIIKTKGVSIVDWNLSDSDAVNQYVNRLIRLSLKRFFDSRDADQCEIINTIDKTNSNRKSANQEMGPRVKRIRRSYVKKGDLDEEPLVSVFDNFVTFQETRSTIQFKNPRDNEFVEKGKVFNLIEKLIEADNLLFYITLKRYFTHLFNVIKNRILVVIYLNEIYFEKFLNFLIDKEFYFHLIIITAHNQLPVLLRKKFYHFKSIDYLKISNSSSESNHLEIKSYDKTKYKDVLTVIRV